MSVTLVTGASGKLGAYVVRHLQSQGKVIEAWSNSASGSLFGQKLKPVDLACEESVRSAWSECQPDVVIHCAAMSAVGDCFADPIRAQSVNHRGTAILGSLAPQIVYVSTDMVFDGDQSPYSERDEPNPLSIYGKSKLDGERALEAHPKAAVARVGLLYGPSLSSRAGFFDQQIRALKAGDSLNLFHDEWRTPLALDEAAKGLVRLANLEAKGLYHLAGPQRMSRFQMGAALANYLGFTPESLNSVSQKSVDFPEKRPTDVSLHCNLAKIEWGWEPSSFDEGLNRLIGTPPISSIKK